MCMRVDHQKQHQKTDNAAGSRGFELLRLEDKAMIRNLRRRFSDKELSGFVLVLTVIWLDVIVDIPSVFFRTPDMPSGIAGTLLRTVAVLMIGILAVCFFLWLSRMVRQSAPARRSLDYGQTFEDRTELDPRPANCRALHGGALASPINYAPRSPIPPSEQIRELSPLCKHGAGTGPLGI
jgi:hypothetical protein